MNINRLAELALAQITDMTLENFNLRMSLEGEREHVKFLEGEMERVEFLEQQVKEFGVALNDRWAAFERMEKMRDNERERADAAESLLRSAVIERDKAQGRVKELEELLNDGRDATCEHCGAPAEYDSDMCLCVKCEEKEKGA